MPNKAVVHTDEAPAAIGTYSQAISVSGTVYLSGQIPLDPQSMAIIEGDFRAQATQVFKNLAAVCKAANGDLAHIVKLNLYLTDLSNFPVVNEVMAEFFNEPYPARAAIGVSELPKGAQVEADAIMVV